jgi:hypothetical protein
MRQPGGVRRALVIMWILLSAVPLLGIALGILTEPNFPLGLGIIRTRGLTGLWVTFLPAVVGVAGVVLLRWPGRGGAALVLAYSSFWAVLLGGMLPVVWNAESSFCLRGLGVCITAAWLGRLTVLGLLTAFLLASTWCVARLRRGTLGKAGGLTGP